MSGGCNALEGTLKLTIKNYQGCFFLGHLAGSRVQLPPVPDARGKSESCADDGVATLGDIAAKPDWLRILTILVEAPVRLGRDPVRPEGRFQINTYWLVQFNQLEP